MAHTVSIDAKTIQAILARLDKLTSDVATIKEKLFSQEPPYGSDAWWEWSDKKALKDIKVGKGIKFKTAKEAIQWLNS